MRPYAFALLLLCSGIGACASALRPPDPSWPRVQGEGPYTIAIPPELQRTSAAGVDSDVAEWRGSSLRISLHYTVYGSGLGDRSGAERGRLVVDGRTGRWMLYRRQGEEAEASLPYVFTAFFPRIARAAWTDGWYSLVIAAECGTEQDCEIARRIIESIRWTRATETVESSKQVPDDAKLDRAPSWRGSGSWGPSWTG